MCGTRVGEGREEKEEEMFERAETERRQKPPAQHNMT
jgi:hypothetical protein